MTPQVYNECERSDKHNSEFFKEINEANDKKNANLTEKLSKGEKLTKDDIEPIEYAVPRIHVSLNWRKRLISVFMIFPD